ncbi:MAG: tRNA pseudouridine synthase A, partial [Chloroflexi bacterium]|nr:tRNA pseudouridine synthase A [Chloroflexota bacterium]
MAPGWVMLRLLPGSISFPLVTSDGQTSKIALILEYDGTRYCGFQYQSGVPTIQGELEKAITRLTGERRRVLAASRTDTGVHAWGQVASFRTGAQYPAEVFRSALNHYLPEDIAVRSAHRVRDDFNVLRQATGREYEYHILNSRTRSPLRKGRAHLVPQPLDVEAMARAARDLEGTHDFASFVTD